MRCFVCLLLAALGAATSVAVPTPSQAAATRACQLPDVARPTRCGQVSVLENPRRADSRRLEIHFAVIPASSQRGLPDPIVVLMGGPGEMAIESAHIYVEKFAALLTDRDLLLVDQRGTGQSAPLQCHVFSPGDPAASVRDFLPTAAVSKCVQKLEKTADLRRYTTPYFVDDLEQVRRALGYGPLNLYSGSYGTRAAQAYLRQFPQSVRTAFLASPVPFDTPSPADFARTEERALDLMFENCAADGTCRAAFPKLREEFQELVKRLDAGDVRVRVPGASEPVTLSRGYVAEWVRHQLYRPRGAADLPWFLHRAYGGDWSPIVADMISDARDVEQELSFGVFLSVTCSEDVPFIDEKAAVGSSRDTFLGDYRLRQQQAACSMWPKAQLPEDYHQPVRSSTPVLLVTGDLDGGTPLWFTDRVAKGLTNHATIVIHGQGHTEWNECVAQRFQQLVQSDSARGLDSPACPPVPLPPFKT